MSKQWLARLDFIRALDETGKLSLSNIALWVMIAKVAWMASFSMADAAMLLPVIGNYSIKRWVQRKHRQGKDQANLTLANEATQLLAQLEADVERLKVQIGFRPR